MLSPRSPRRALAALAITAGAATAVALPSAVDAAHLVADDEVTPVVQAPSVFVGGASEEPADDAGENPLVEVCPLDGPATFEDSWGWARSGGRRHQGVDMIAERGVPVVAVRDGAVRFKNSGLGGRAAWLTTDDGDRFYYAHLDGWNGESRQVAAGELIGWVGSTGNARGPHLHFETHPEGSAVNPFPAVLQACVPPGLLG